nr:proteasome subunit beta type-3-like [Equus asinus]
MLTTDLQKIFPMGEWLDISLTGLATNFQTTAQHLKFQLNLCELNEGSQIKPYTLMSVMANLLYKKQFGPCYTEPVIAWLDLKTFTPFVCSLDLISCPMVTDDFVVSSTSAEQMCGMYESLWEPIIAHLLETVSQAMLNAVDGMQPGVRVISTLLRRTKSPPGY